MKSALSLLFLGIGIPILSLARVEVSERVAVVDPGVPRLGWKAFGAATLDSGEANGELWQVVNWSEAAKWGVGNRFTFKQPVRLHAYRAVELEVLSSDEAGGSVSLGIESQKGRTLRTPVADSGALSTTWKKVEFPVSAFKDAPFEAADWESVTQLKVFFIKPGATTKEKLSFRNVALIP